MKPIASAQAPMKAMTPRSGSINGIEVPRRANRRRGTVSVSRGGMLSARLSNVEQVRQCAVLALSAAGFSLRVCLRRRHWQAIAVSSALARYPHVALFCPPSLPPSLARTQLLRAMDADGDGRVGRHEFCAFFISNSELLPWFGFGVDVVVTAGGEETADVALQKDRLLAGRKTVGHNEMMDQLRQMSQHNVDADAPPAAINGGCCTLS